MVKQVIYMWIDFSSPLSYIAFNNMRKALEQSKRQDLILNLKSYQLEPSLDIYDDDQIKESKKRIRASKRLIDKPRVSTLLKNAGIKINWKRIMPINTVNPHKLLQLAKTFDDEHRVANELAESIFKVYWSDGLDISNQEELVKIALANGIDEKSALNVFDAEKYLEMICLDEQEGIDDGITGAPYTSLPNDVKISGAFTIKQALDYINDIPAVEN